MDRQTRLQQAAASLTAELGHRDRSELLHALVRARIAEEDCALLESRIVELEAALAAVTASPETAE